MLKGEMIHRIAVQKLQYDSHLFLFILVWLGSSIYVNVEVSFFLLSDKNLVILAEIIINVILIWILLFINQIKNDFNFSHGLRQQPTTHGRKNFQPYILTCFRPNKNLIHVIFLLFCYF